ncbi:MAG: hypothetical protein KDJ28_18920 [Candidatus Competibacteraceae bacterium]|nr:hypothetical protein [Candidatus Competibacteraceae bacterium]
MNYNVKFATDRNSTYSTHRTFDNCDEAISHANYLVRFFGELTGLTNVIVQTEYDETVLFLSAQEQEVAAY